MQYGHFDNKSREYVIDRVDLPVSWTNYIGVGDMYGVFNHTAGGYLLYKTPEYHRITRFRPNGVPMDGPGHYIYIRDDETDRMGFAVNELPGAGVRGVIHLPDCGEHTLARLGLDALFLVYNERHRRRRNAGQARHIFDRCVCVHGSQPF